MVLMLQETRFSHHEHAPFSRHAHKKGFSVYHVDGAATTDRWGAPRAAGGVTMLVDRRLKTGGWIAEAGTACGSGAGGLDRR